MDTSFFEEIFWGNTIKQYVLFGVIILLGLIFKRIISRLLSRLTFKLFKKFADEVNSETFIALLLKPIEFFISMVTLYTAINQLKHPLRCYTGKLQKGN